MIVNFAYLLSDIGRLRDALSKEISLVQQAMELGEDGTPPHHWDQLVAVRGSLCDLKHNLRTLFSEFLNDILKFLA